TTSTPQPSPVTPISLLEPVLPNDQDSSRRFCRLRAAFTSGPLGANSLGARAVFSGQIDGATEINSARAQATARLVALEVPDGSFTIRTPAARSNVTKSRGPKIRMSAI